MKKLIISLACLSLSTLALAGSKVDAPQAAYIANKSDTTVTVDYQLCQAPFPIPKGDACQPVTSVDVPSAKLSPGKNVIVIPFSGIYIQLSVVKAVEKASGKVVAQSTFIPNFGGQIVSNCGGANVTLDDMNGSPYISCTFVNMGQ